MNRFFKICYEIVLWIMAIVVLPKMIYAFFVHRKYRMNLACRLGIDRSLAIHSSAPVIWIHAVSVGETRAVSVLARELKHRFPKHPLIVSSITETGHAEAKRSLPFADHHIYLPFDFRWMINKMVRQVKLKLVILCESDFWFNFLDVAKRQGAILAVVNGKMSERSMSRFHKVPFFSKSLFGLFDVICVQNQLYYSRLLKAGATVDQMVITGNLKLDEEYPQLSMNEKQQWLDKLGLEPHQLLLTIGSTHAPEEQFLVKILKKIWEQTPQLRVLLVPRRPERFDEVASLLEKERLNWVRLTEISRRTGKEQVILIDAMGLLRMCYQLSDFAIVGGSFTPLVGGHNIIEPCGYGKPVLFGPYMQTQLELVDLVKQYGAGYQVNEGDLSLILNRWIQSSEERLAMGRQGICLIRELKGSTTRTLNALEPYI